MSDVRTAELTGDEDGGAVGDSVVAVPLGDAGFVILGIFGSLIGN